MKLLSVKDYIGSFNNESESELRIKNGSAERAINGGYHLAIGDATSYDRGRIAPSRGKVTINPNETIVFKSQEYFYVPNDVCGFGVNRVWDCVRQLRIDSTFIDPGYEGKLHIIVTNYGSHAVTLTTKEPLLKIVLFRVDEPLNKATIAPNRNDIDTYLNRIADEISRSKENDEDTKKSKSIWKWFTGIGIVITILVSLELYLYSKLTFDEFLKVTTPIVSIAVAAIIAPISSYFMIKRNEK